MPAGQVSPGSIVIHDGRRYHVAAVGLAGMVALEEHGRSLSGASTWIELDAIVELVEAYRARDVAAGAAYDPLLQGAA